MLKGKRVILRPMEKRDLGMLVQWRNDPRILHSFFSPFLVHPAGQDKWYEDLQHDPTRLVLIIDTINGKTIGMIGLDNIDQESQQCESGFLLVEPDQRDNAQVIEACLLLTEYGFKELNMHRMYAVTFADRFDGDWFELTGWQREVVLRQSVFIGGKFHDKVVWGVMRDDWMKAMYGEVGPN